MIDEQFSSQEFEKLGLDTEAARSRVDALSLVIQQELKILIDQKLKECISSLNSMNHYFELQDNQLDYISYCDNSDRNNTYTLMISLDLIVMSGYAHLVSNDEEETYLEEVS
jgi:hypothetical protein